MFHERVISFKNRKGEFKFHDTNLSNTQVLDVFLKGRQYNETTDDYEIDVDLTIYHSRWTSTIGYTYPNTVRTWVNRKFFSVYTPAKVAGNVSHEYCHKIGFEHTVAWTINRDDSVPYAIGYIIQELAELYVKSMNNKLVLGYPKNTHSISGQLLHDDESTHAVDALKYSLEGQASTKFYKENAE